MVIVHQRRPRSTRYSRYGHGTGSRAPDRTKSSTSDSVIMTRRSKTDKPIVGMLVIKTASMEREVILDLPRGEFILRDGSLWEPIPAEVWHALQIIQDTVEIMDQNIKEMIKRETDFTGLPGENDNVWYISYDADGEECYDGRCMFESTTVYKLVEDWADTYRSLKYQGIKSKYTRFANHD